MRRLVFIGVLAASAAFLLVAAAGADIGWLAKWKGKAPVTVSVSGVSSFPAADQVLIRAAMADWSASPSVEFVEGTGVNNVTIQVSGFCSYACTAMGIDNHFLRGAAIHINPVVLSWTERQWIYCHELGHALGLAEGTPLEQTGDYGSCMAGDGDHPSQMDFDVLSKMYPLRGNSR